MNKLSGIVLFIAASVLLSGCLTVKEETPPPAAPTASPAPQEDTRSVGQLRAENNDLRGKLAKAEKDRKAWESAVDYRKSQLKALERDRDRVKKERDDAKKAAKRADKD
jgi:hypothetical protein